LSDSYVNSIFARLNSDLKNNKKMQNKGVVKLFAILFGLVSLYQLSFTFKANSLEDKAKQYAVSNFNTANDINEAEVRYLDSISSEKVFDLGISDFTYNEVKDKAMNLGLDLKGGNNYRKIVKIHT